MAYQALYRQWRPMDFSSMVSQEAVVATLRNQINTGRIAHAYLFCGSRGTGKTSTAKIMARAINCLSPVNGDPCGQCESCRRLLAEESMDVMEIDAASNNGVDEIRDLRETVKYPPQHGKFKVYIIDEVHMLSASAFNALLKTLEEPPAHVCFILATTEPQKLPATILSRCQRFDFGRIPAHQIAGRLRQAVEGANATATDNALHMIARAAEGGMRDALSILDMCLGYRSDVDEELVRSVLGTSDRSFLFRFVDALALEDASTVLGMIDELMRKGREPMVFAKDVSQHLRALLMAKACPDDLPSLLDVTQEDAAEYIGQSDTMTVTRLMKMLDIFMTTETELRWASSPRIVLENTALKCCLRTKEADTAALNDRIAQLEKQLAELTEKLQSGVIAAAPAKKKKDDAPAPQKAEPPRPKVLTPTGRSADEAWKEALSVLKKTDIPTHSFLTQGRLVGCDGTLYRWEAPVGMDFFANALNKEDKRRAICNALTEAAGVECQFEAVTAGASKPAEESVESFVSGLEQTFGKANVLVQDEPK
ncbi:MAG: DNA polymerase III subunit gamma/tau [Clostridiales bacterium]|nr:DNA polymerase III subunit gamma/tau [Clostridiales bacterium]